MIKIIEEDNIDSMRLLDKTNIPSLSESLLRRYFSKAGVGPETNELGSSELSVGKIDTNRNI